MGDDFGAPSHVKEPAPEIRMLRDSAVAAADGIAGAETSEAESGKKSRGQGKVLRVGSDFASPGAAQRCGPIGICAKRDGCKGIL
jgi:hypothetical protein